MRKAAVAKIGGKRGSIGGALSYSLGHRFRIEILAALHEGPASAKQLSRVLRQPLSNVTHHIGELLADGAIEVARAEEVGNITQHFYCVAELPEYSSEEFAALGSEEREATLALILQASTAEAMASLWAGKLHTDPKVMLAWNRIYLDTQGRDDLAEEQDRSWLRIKEIEVESANRYAQTGEDGKTYVVTSYGYERVRTSAPEPLNMPPG
jgi:DNA-binding transcriptional ArsR family regulator